MSGREGHLSLSDDVVRQAQQYQADVCVSSIESKLSYEEVIAEDGSIHVGIAVEEHFETADAAYSDEYVCTITSKLPIEPVKAEDGRIYERCVIEKHIGTNVLDLRSPATDEPMGPWVFPALEVRSAIKALVLSDTIRGEEAEYWTKRIKENEEVAALQEKAQNGDTTAMCELGFLYAKGDKGLAQNQIVAHSWYKKAANNGDSVGMAGAGYNLMFGIGVTKNKSEGMKLMNRAMEGASEFATFNMGIWYCRGLHGVKVDREQSRKLLRRVVNGSCEIKNLPPFQRDIAARLLSELETGKKRTAAF